MNEFVKVFDDSGVGLFARPLATEKILKKVLKILKHIKTERKKYCIMGIKPVTKAIYRDNESGILLLAGDVKQIDIIAHLPIICEEHHIPYVWIAHRRQLCSEETGLRPKTVPAVILLQKKNLDEKFQTKFDDLSNKILKITPVFE